MVKNCLGYLARKFEIATELGAIVAVAVGDLVATNLSEPFSLLKGEANTLGEAL